MESEDAFFSHRLISFEVQYRLTHCPLVWTLSSLPEVLLLVLFRCNNAIIFFCSLPPLSPLPSSRWSLSPGGVTGDHSVTDGPWGAQSTVYSSFGVNASCLLLFPPHCTASPTFHQTPYSESTYLLYTSIQRGTRVKVYRWGKTHYLPRTLSFIHLLLFCTHAQACVQITD